jgi:hypothetical protein
MQELASDLIHSGYIVPLGIVSLGVLVAIVAIIAGAWRKVRRAELDAELKHKMLDQGMSADDICKVLEVSSGRCRHRRSDSKLARNPSA